jgi:hypothetical protein
MVWKYFTPVSEFTSEEVAMLLDRCGLTEMHKPPMGPTGRVRVFVLIKRDGSFSYALKSYSGNDSMLNSNVTRLTAAQFKVMEVKLTLLKGV